MYEVTTPLKSHHITTAYYNRSMQAYSYRDTKSKDLFGGNLVRNFALPTKGMQRGPRSAFSPPTNPSPSQKNRIGSSSSSSLQISADQAEAYTLVCTGSMRLMVDPSLFTPIA